MYVQVRVPRVPLERATMLASSPSVGLSCCNLWLQTSEQRQSHHVAVSGRHSANNEAGCLIKSHEAHTQKNLTSKASKLPLVCLLTCFDRSTNATMSKSQQRLLHRTPYSCYPLASENDLSFPHMFQKTENRSTKGLGRRTDHKTLKCPLENAGVRKILHIPRNSFDHLD